MKFPPQAEFLTQKDLSNLLGGVTVKTISRWRVEGRCLEPDGFAELVFLYSINTAGARVRGGRVLIPWDHDESRHGCRYLGASQFLAALGADPILRRMEMSMEL